jgi:hypothetical protein
MNARRRFTQAGPKKEVEVGYAVVLEEQKIKKNHKRCIKQMEKKIEGDNHGLVEYNDGRLEQKTDKKP